MRKVIGVMALLAVLAAGVLAPTAISRIKHTGSSGLTCTTATWNFVDFAAGKNNTVRLKFYKNAVLVIDQDFTFYGANGSKTISTNLQGSGTFEAKASWNTNGHVGSYTSNVGPFACETRTETVTLPGTTSTVTNTVTTPPVTNTVTVTTPGTPSQQTTPITNTVTNTVTQPAPPAQTVTLPAVTLPTATVKITVPKPYPPCMRGWHRAGHGNCYKVKRIVKVIHDRPVCPPKPDVPPRCEGDCSRKKLTEGGSG